MIAFLFVLGCITGAFALGTILAHWAPNASATLLPEPPVDVQVWRERHHGTDQDGAA